MGALERKTGLNISKLVEKARGDVALANPVAFLIRMMNGEYIDGEQLDLRARVDVAKFLAARMMPAVEPEDVTGEVRGTTQPLTIILNAAPGEIKTVGGGATVDVA